MSRLAESSAGGEKKEGEGKHEVVKKKDEYRIPKIKYDNMGRKRLEIINNDASGHLSFLSLSLPFLPKNCFSA